MAAPLDKRRGDRSGRRSSVKLELGPPCRRAVQTSVGNGNGRASYSQIAWQHWGGWSNLAAGLAGAARRHRRGWCSWAACSGDWITNPRVSSTTWLFRNPGTVIRGFLQATTRPLPAHHRPGHHRPARPPFARSPPARPPIARSPQARSPPTRSPQARPLPPTRSSGPRASRELSNRRGQDLLDSSSLSCWYIDASASAA